MATDSATTLILGATGTVGRRLVRKLASGSAPIRAATRLPEAYAPPGARAEAVRFDFTDPSTFAPALEGVARVSMLAPSDTAVYPQLVPFIDAVAQSQAEHVVFMTAMGVDQAPDDVPLRRAELHLQASPLHATLLRPNWFMQNVLTYWHDMIMGDGVLRLPAGDAQTSFIDAGDIAAVAAAALTDAAHRGTAYTLTGPEALTYAEAADVLSQVWGRDISYEAVSDEAARAMFAQAGLDEAYAQMLVGLFQNVRAGHAAPVTEAVEEITGQPPRSLQQFARGAATAFASS